MRPNSSLFPPNGFTHKSDGRTWTGDSWGDVARQIENFRRAAGAPIGKPLEEIYEAFCRAFPHYCVNADKNRVFVDMARSDVGFGQRVVSWVANSASTPILRPASGDVANARALVCMHCPEQSEWHGSCGCDPAKVEKVAKVFFKNLGHGPSPETNGLKACRALGEDCRLSVWMSQRGKNVGQPGHCWRLNS